MSPSIPLTPDPIEFAPLKTPRNSDSPSWNIKYWYLGNIAQFVAFGSLAIYITAAVVYLTPYYWKIDPKLAVWWGVPTEEELEAEPTISPGHGEMTLPTYLFLGLFVPMLLTMVAVPFLRRFNVRRITSRHLMNVAIMLRRKPFAFGRLSYFGYGELLFLVVFLLGGNVMVSWYQYDAYIDFAATRGELTLDVYLSQIGILLGYTCVWNMAFLFLPATRNSVWMELLGISYANGIKYHRWAGVMVVLTAVLHTIPYYWMWLKNHEWMDEALPCFNCKVDSESEGRHVWFNVFGELALLCFLAIAVLSLPIVRRRMYESFYYVHHLFIPGVIFTVLHWNITTWFIFPSFLVYLIDRAASSSNAFWPVRTTEFTVLPDGIIKIVIARSPYDDGHYNIGQFVYLNAPAVSKLQWHPFTIASSPKTSHHSFTILLKSLGDWTTDLRKYAEECQAQHQAPTLFIDGYYGESLDKYADYETLWLVAGGVGITPILAILEDIAATHEMPRQRVFLTFAFREPSLLEQLHPVLSKLREIDPHEQLFRFQLYLTRVSDDTNLDRSIHASHSTKLDAATLETSTGTVPFSEPLRTHGLKPLIFLIVISLAVFLVAWLEYGNGRIVDGGAKSQLWMAQYTTEIAVLFLCPLGVYAAVAFERFTRRSRRHDTEPVECCYAAPSDVQTLRDLLACYDVTVGKRPAMDELVVGVRDARGVVGVFVSGPPVLKAATEYAIARAGATGFDIHSEEFEL